MWSFKTCIYSVNASFKCLSFLLCCSYSASGQPAYNQAAYSQAAAYSQPQGGYQAQQPGYGQQQQSSYGQGQPPQQHQQGPPAAYPPQGNSSYGQPQYGQQSASQNDYQQSSYSKGVFTIFHYFIVFLSIFLSVSYQVMAICLVRDLSCRQLQSEWCERRLLRVAAAGWIPRRFRQRWLWSRSSWTWGYGPRRHGVSSDFNVTNCSLLSRSLIWLSGITRHMQGLYVQVSKKSGVSCVVHPTIILFVEVSMIPQVYCWRDVLFWSCIWQTLYLLL